jgi:cytochrome c-type biogenesis protein CcmF
MSDRTYLGEHLWVGELGHIFIILSFVAALFSVFAYYKSTVSVGSAASETWKIMGRYGFITHGFTLFGLMGLLFYAMYHHMYEYSYVFDHVSDDLPLKYILSAFWEGQEGSFMLWMFWHVILGFILITKAGKFEMPVMFTIALAEAIIMTMILGIHIPWGDTFIKIGSNPTTLLRHLNDAPIFANADYLSLIKGRGLNPLLQNYWMTIHPPTLFLGFASTIVPFAFAFGGLWQNEHKEWLKEALPWTLFSAGILGTGILMGSLWAYVALSFGGYWAWDPVENASLVPWITLVAGIHMHLISRNTGYATRSVYFFYLISFLLILYSTFLTRSGVLGDTSAHAFTEMGLEWQLIILIGIFLISSLSLLAYRYKSIDQPKNEEAIPSREFWMFIGGLVLLFSALLITASTSLPVFNKIMTWFDPTFEGRVISEPVSHYNKYQLWIGVFVAMLSSFSIFLRYGAVNWDQAKKTILRNNAVYLVSALVLTGLSSLWLEYYSWQYILLSYTGMYGVIANADYLVRKAKGNLRLGASALAHMGFALMLVGILASGLNQKFISTNPFVFKGLFTDDDLKKYVQLIKGKPLYSQGYYITYESDTLVDRERRYAINFKKLSDSMEILDEMTLYPNAVYANDFSKIAAYNPDTKHYFQKDIFTCVVGVPPAVESAENARKIEDTLTYKEYKLLPGDTLKAGKYVLKTGNITYQPQHPEYVKSPHDAGVGITFEMQSLEDSTVYTQEAAMGMQGALLYTYPASFEEAGIRIKLDENFMDAYFTPENELTYQEYTFRNGQSTTIDDINILLTGFQRNPKHPSYEAKEGDIALSANLVIRKGDALEKATPIYIIRDNQPMSIKYYSAIYGVHIRFSNIDPESETFTFTIARENRKIQPLGVKIASNVPRSDYIILQATIFPGINLFWVGTILMMMALFLAAWRRHVVS